MYTIIWEYLIEEDRTREFEAMYGPRGTWAQLFAKHPGFVETVLLCDPVRPQRYATIDRWRQESDFKAFLQLWKADYERIDLEAAELTKSEIRVGAFETVG